MSVWSKLRFAKRAAKDHKAAAAKSDEAPKEAYKHTPRHAAVDALSGAPSSWKVEDRPKIREQHKRRSQLNIHRAGSSLSTVTYGGRDSPLPAKPTLLRHSSYNSYNPTWNERGDNGSHANDNIRRNVSKLSIQTGSNGESSVSAGRSPLMSNVVSKEVSPITSSSNSATSVELRPNKSEYVYSEHDIFEKLHTSTNRRIGEAPILSAPRDHSLQSRVPRVMEQPVAKKARWSLKGKNRVLQVGVAA